MSTLGNAQLPSKPDERTVTKGLVEIRIRSKIVETRELNVLLNAPNPFNVLPVTSKTITNKQLRDFYNIWDIKVCNTNYHYQGKIIDVSEIQKMFKKDWQAITWASDVESYKMSALLYIKLLSLVSENVGMCATPKTDLTPAKMQPNVVVRDALDARSLLNLSQQVRNEQMRFSLIISEDAYYARTTAHNLPNFLSHWRDTDNDKNYSEVTVPLFPEERMLVDICSRAMGGLFIDLLQARDFLTRISFPNFTLDVQSFNKTYVSKFMHTRVGRPLEYSVDVTVYYLNAQILLRVAKQVEQGIRLRIDLDDQNSSAADIRISLKVATLVASEAQRVVMYLAPMAITQVYPCLLLPLINPNLNQVNFKLNVVPLTINDLYSIIILMTMTSCHTVTVASRVFINNVIAYYLISDCLVNPARRPDVFRTISNLRDWFMPNVDRLLSVYENRMALIPDARIFLEELCANDLLKHRFDGDNSHRISTLCESVWADGRPLDRPHMYGLSEDFRRIIKVHSSPIIIPYSIENLRNFTFTRFMNLIDLLHKTIQSKQQRVTISATPALSMALAGVIKKNAMALNLYFNNILENIDRMASLPVTDSIVRHPNPYVNVRDVAAVDMLSCLVFPIKDDEFQGPNSLVLNFDPEITIGLPMLMSSYKRLVKHLGQNSRLFKRGQKIRFARELYSNVSFISSSVLDLWLSDAHARDALIANDTISSEPLENIFQLTDQLHNLMQSEENRKMMGFSDHFFIVVEPYQFKFLLGSSNVFVSNAMNVKHLSVSEGHVLSMNDVVLACHSGEMTATPNMTRTGSKFAKLMSELNRKKSALSAYDEPEPRTICAIRVNYPCIIDLVVTDSANHNALVSTPVDVNAWKTRFLEHKPIIIRTEVQYVSERYTTHDDEFFIKYETCTPTAVITTDQLPMRTMPFQAYINDSHGKIITRDEPLSVEEKIDVRYSKLSENLY